MKVLFVTRTAAHFAYHESTIRHLCDKGHSVDHLYDREHTNPGTDHAARACSSETPGLTLGWSLRRQGVLRRPLFTSRELLSYASYLTREDQVEFYRKRWHRYLPTPARELMARVPVARGVVASGPARSALRAVERLAPPDRGITRMLKEASPDVVVASPLNMRYSEEVEYVKAARALGIPTVVAVLSWDNLTTKGLVHIVPDVLLAWNEAQFREAVSIHHVPPERIVITGAPFLDKWFDKPVSTLGEREFRGKVGLEHRGPFVLYLGSSANISGDESWLVLKIAESLRSSRDERIRNLTVLVRPHGANQEVFRKIAVPNVKVWLRDKELPDSGESFAEFEAAIRLSAACVGLNTTAMVDALLADKPVVTMLVEEYGGTNAAQAVHFRYLLDADVYARASSPDMCAHLVARLLDGEDPKRESRRRFALDFVRPRGLETSAGEIAAKAIVLAAEGKTATEINAAVDATTSPRLASTVAVGTTDGDVATASDSHRAPGARRGALPRERA